jgi:endo-1,4-beta-xylanase
MMSVKHFLIAVVATIMTLGLWSVDHNSLMNFWATAKSLPDRALWQVAPFPVGVGCDPSLLEQRPGYRQVIKTEFNSITPETEQKWVSIHPEQNRYSFTKADYLVDWAVANGKRVHGHTLLWHPPDTLPKWLKEFQGDRAAWENLMKTHIQTVVGHYRGKVKSWDVVNEGFNDDGTVRMANNHPNPSSENDNGSIWARHLGPDYMARAFQYAHTADPKALLFYNEYGQDTQPRKIAAINKMVTDFRQRKIPIDGLGLQFHLDLNATEANITRAIRETAKSGLLVHISELDVLVSNWKKNPDLVYSPELQKQQGAKYKFIAQQYQRLVPKKQRYGITHWNVGDGDSWITNWMKLKDWPLLFDDKYQRKKIYYDYRDGLKPIR